MEENINTESVSQKKDNEALMGILCYLGILVLVPLLTEAKKNPFIHYHIRQGIAFLVVSVVGAALAPIPFVGTVSLLAIMVLLILGIVNVLQKKQKPLPVIGTYAEKINI